MALAGRGFGKTRTITEWARDMIESGQSRRMAIVGSTAADVRDVLIEGQSGILAVCPPWNRPRYEPSKRRLTWPNGAIATCYSAEEPNRLRGPQHDAAIADELAAWEYPETYDQLMLGLRLGQHPKLMIATTPRPTKLVKELVADPQTILVRGSTFENRPHLAPTFFDKVVAKYQGTRLGRQEIFGDILLISEGAWFARFDPDKHVSDTAEYDRRYPVHLAIDCGTSQTVGAVFYQVKQIGDYQHRVTVFGEYMKKGLYSEANAKAIMATSENLPSRGQLETIVLDPHGSGATTGIGPSAYSEFQRIFGSRRVSKAPGGSVIDGLDQVELLMETGCLVIHSRCEHLKMAFQNFSRKELRGDFLDEPAPNQNPHVDMIDALRYGVRSKFPEGREQQKRLRTVHPGQLY